MRNPSEEFYVGYMKKAPRGVARYLRWQILLILFISIGVAAGIAYTQRNVHPVTFEFGVLRNLSGIVYETPYPHLLVERPHAEEETSSFSRYTLVAPGKFGAGELVEGMHGKHVELKGTLIYKDT